MKHIRSVILLTLLLACAGCGEQNSGENVSGLSQADAEALNDAAEKLDDVGTNSSDAP